MPDEGTSSGDGIVTAQDLADHLPELRENVGKLTAAITADGFGRALEEIQRRRGSEGLTPDELIGLASPGALRDRGVPIPEGTRVSTRYFEDPDAVVQSHISVSDMVFARLPEAEAETGTPVGITVCVSVGTPGVPVCVTVGDNF